MRKFFILPLALALTACGNPPMEQQSSKNGNSASLIAEVDGCRVWRIDQGGLTDRVYMARCPEGSASTQHSVSCGKNCVRQQYTIAARGAQE